MPAEWSGEIDALMRAGRAKLAAGDGPSALQRFTEALQRDNALPEAFLGAGLALESMGDDRAADASYRHAVTLDPALANAHGALAALAARHGDWIQARTSAESALAILPTESSASVALAQIRLREDLPAEALSVLASVIWSQGQTLQHAFAHRLGGTALERLGRTAEAFAQWGASAAIFRARYAVGCAGPEPMTGLDLCLSLERRYADGDAALWRAAPGESGGPAAGHVFLVGFPRSGTTLLEQALAGHPDVVALEERPTLVAAIDAFLDPPLGVEALARLDQDQADHWRGQYWAQVRANGADVSGKIFVDKQPFYGLWLPLIGKLFPQAKIVVARRDPRDVVLSCLRNPFRMTPVTYELMDLERGAALYAGTMRIIDLFRARSANPVFEHRHETLVDDFEGAVRPLCAFLNLPWTDCLADFAATAARREIRTPSADQVRRGLNRDGVGAWRRYAAELAPVLPMLSPLAERYGYPP
ncbi:MAG TPA: sulfotransferase [Caulobacteraceae bacterium]|nr:sulfotransferase [Caulobacteraceae bacterium]